jgi:hypothetical protein
VSSRRTRGSLKRTSAVSALLVAGFAGLAASLAWQSRSWPLVHDAPILHYIAWRIGDGAVPYRDVFDMNQPGAYLLHLAVLQTLGAGDVAWRVFDLGWLAITALAIAAFAAPWGTAAAAGGALVFATYHLAGGAWQAGQRDFLLCPFLVVGLLGVARWLEQRGRVASLACSGAAMGAAVTVKPHAVVLAAALAVIVAIVSTRADGLAGIAPLLAYAVAAALPPAAILGWLTATGAVGAWCEAVFDYLLPLYSRLGRDTGWTIHRWQIWIPLALAVGLSVLAAAQARRLGARHKLALLGIAYGLVHFVGQGKGWDYHLYPLAAFAAVLVFSGLAPALSARRWIAAPLAAALLAAVVLLGIKGVEAAPARWEKDKAHRVGVLVDDLRARVRPGDRVQVLDTSVGGAHALLRLGMRQPTRFVYDFHFFHDVDTPVVRALRAELIRDLDAQPPRFIVLFEHGWPSGGYERIQAFPELAERLATRYDVVASPAGYRLYAQRARP